MKVQQRLFLQGVQAGQVTCTAAGFVYHKIGSGFARRATGDFAAAERSGYLLPCPQGEVTVIRLSDAGEQALADALAERAAVR